MKDIIWVKLPSNSRREDHEKIKDGFKNLNLDDVEVIVTSGDIELHFFNRRVFVYPYWLLKLKMLFK